ncbi:MAG: hypothetical protein HDR34_01690 [Treponema sp.]|nr:hypothetical protein [Treponema sp.]
MIDLNKLARYALKTAIKREKKGQLKSDTMLILKHCAGELCEATEAFFNWIYFKRDRNKENLADELADVMTCALIAAEREGVDIEAEREGVDIEAALLRVQEKDARRAE